MKPVPERRGCAQGGNKEVCRSTPCPCVKDKTPGRGILKFGFGRDVLPRNLKVDPYKYQFFKKKEPIHIPIGPILGQILSKCKIT